MIETRYFCKTCRYVMIAVDPEVAANRQPVSCACGSMAVWTFAPPQVQFRGDAWSTKNDKVREQMKAKNKALDKRQDALKREQPGLSLVPNVDGEEVENWAEAVKLAKDKKKDLTGYEQKLEKEKAGYKS